MDQQKVIEPKKVNIEKLKLLTKEQLEERIKEIPLKIKAKQEYYFKMNQTNQDRLKSYVTHKREEEAVSKKILVELQKNPASEKKLN